MSEPKSQIELIRLRASLGAKLASEARKRGVTADLVRKQYIFTIFLSRIFQDDAAPWVLLGGNALMIRTGHGRFTQDVDLARQSAWRSLDDALAELRMLSSRPYRNDPFEFKLDSVEQHQEPDPYGYGAETGKVKARAMLAGRDFESFSIDLTTRRHVDGRVDNIPLRPIIEHETLEELPAVPTTPIENHLADKICALFERHGPDGSVPSTRYRDLADIVRIIKATPFDAGRLMIVLEREADRRRMTLPAGFIAPSADWVAAFPRAAANFAEYPRELWDLAAALTFCGACLDEVLAGHRRGGIWDPRDQSWK
jgi:hypothetical protein